jgi:hypothetical protein
VTPKLVIYTDGACRGNPGPGGWGALLMYGDKKKELMGGELATTNNRMELMAAIQALEALNKPTKVDLHTDSQYVMTASPSGSTAGRPRAGRPPTRSRSRTSTCGNAWTPPGQPPRRRLALGQGPRRPRPQRAGRRAGATGHAEGAGRVSLKT